MPIAKEFRITIADRPGTLGQLCQALAAQSVNILAYQSAPLKEGKSSVRLVLDNPAIAKTVLDRERTKYTEAEVAKVTLIHRPGELARAASRLGEVGININYGCCGVGSGKHATILIFGVAKKDKNKAVKLLEQAAAASSTT